MNTGKVFAKNKTGTMLLVGSDEKSAIWAFIPFKEANLAVHTEAQSVTIGDSVKFDTVFQNGKKILSQLEKIEGLATDTAPVNKMFEKKTTSYTKDDSAYQKPKTPEEQESIKRQAILHAVSRTLIGLQGTIDPNNVLEISKTLYEHYYKMIG